jgi:hypothetical protein
VERFLQDKVKFAGPARRPSADLKDYVLLEASVAPDGTIGGAKVLSTDLPPKFTTRALGEIRTSLIQPRLENGKPVTTLFVRAFVYGKEANP